MTLTPARSAAVARVRDLTQAEGLTGPDLLAAFVTRRVLPLQSRPHLICQMSGQLDPSRMCTALYMMVLYDRARMGSTMKTSDEISIICLFRLILQANILFCFELWYSSCFEVKCGFHTFNKQCSHISTGVLSFLVIEIVMSILFQPALFFAG